MYWYDFHKYNNYMAESSELILLSDWLLERAACLGLPALVPQEKFSFLAS